MVHNVEIKLVTKIFSVIAVNLVNNSKVALANFSYSKNFRIDIKKQILFLNFYFIVSSYHYYGE